MSTTSRTEAAEQPVGGPTGLPELDAEDLLVCAGCEYPYRPETSTSDVLCFTCLNTEDTVRGETR